MNNIYLARHWQNEDNANWILNWHRDLDLTWLWVQQATELANNIKNNKIKIDKIYSSPLSRAYDTAKIISATLNLSEPEKLDLIIERNFGIMTWKMANEIEALCSPNIIKTDTITYFLNPEWAETFEELIIRWKKVIDYINSKYKNKDILLVMHWDIGKMIYAAYYNLDRKKVLTWFHFWNSELLLLSPNTNPNNSQIIKIQQYNH